MRRVDEKRVSSKIAIMPSRPLQRAHRYRLPVGPRRSPETHYVRSAIDGTYLSDVSKVPWVWSARSQMALGFRSKADARAFVTKRMPGAKWVQVV